MWVGLHTPNGFAPLSTEALAHIALQFTPLVTIEAPDLLLLDVRASLQLFGGIETLLNRLRSEYVLAGVSTLQLATAPTPSAAALLARAKRERPPHAQTAAQCQAQIRQLPVSSLSPAPAHQALLQTLGIHTLGDLAMLPRAAVTRRLGRELLNQLDRTLARVPDLRTPYQPAPVFNARLELWGAIEAAPILLFAARRLLGQLAGWLNAGRLGTRHITLSAEHDDLTPTPIEVKLATPSRDPDRLASLLREQLNRLQLPQAAQALRLHCNDATPLADTNGELFATLVPEQEGLGRLLERLHARLGPSGLWRVRCQADHRPEAAYCIEWIEELPKPSPPPGATEASSSRPIGLPRPLWLLKQPLALAERNTRPFWHGPLALVAGPERIETGWWDGNLVERDYFVAQNESAELVWIFRSRTGRDEGELQSSQVPARSIWYLHGFFG